MPGPRRDHEEPTSGTGAAGHEEEQPRLPVPRLHPCHGTRLAMGGAHPSWATGAVADGSVPPTGAAEEVFVNSGVMKGGCCPNSVWIRARRSSWTRSQGLSCGAAVCCLDPNAARSEGLCAQPAFSPHLSSAPSCCPWSSPDAPGSWQEPGSPGPLHPQPQILPQ